MQITWHVSAAHPLPGMEKVCFSPMLWSRHVHSGLAPPLGPSGGPRRTRGMKIKECMTGSADGGHCVLVAIQLQLQITYVREKGADRGSVNRDNPNNVFWRRVNTKPNATAVEYHQRYWTHLPNKYVYFCWVYMQRWLLPKNISIPHNNPAIFPLKRFWKRFVYGSTKSSFTPRNYLHMSTYIWSKSRFWLS